jgi:fructosamine-3-kinase
MLESQIWNEIAGRISQAIDRSFELIDRQSVGGGCINRAYLISNKKERYFVKLNQASLVEMFAAEAKGLQEIAATAMIKVPLPICWGVAQENNSYLVLECLDLIDRGNSQNWVEMGRSLAAMHDYRISNTAKFGWHIHNTIGSTPQLNTWETNWTIFFKNQRLGYQLQLARRKGGHFPQADRLLATIPDLLANHQPQPSLVHGDLWGGNASFTTAGIPVIFDPATYWGDREVDVAMTELFGGFPAAFYQGYASVYPLEPDYDRRKQLYNLYHILNHYNLFGGGYQSQANSAIELLLHAPRP